MATTLTTTLTGNPLIDGLLGPLHWSDPVAFSFPTIPSQYSGYPRLIDHDGNPFTPLIFVDETAGFVAANAAQQAVVRQLLGHVRGITALSIVEPALPFLADIKFGMSNTLVSGQGAAYTLPLAANAGGDIWLNTVSFLDPSLGSSARMAIFQRVGEALGLKAPHLAVGSSTTLLPSVRDSIEFTVMSGRSYEGDPLVDGYEAPAGHYPQSLMMLDIAALQTLYGADYSANAGDTVYAFNPVDGDVSVNGVGLGAALGADGQPNNILFRTIWDGGGNDTYDFSTYSTDLALDLSPGSWTDVDSNGSFQSALLGLQGGLPRQAVGQVFNALLHQGDQRSLIENAIGGSGDDALFGNEIGNRLEGGDGADILQGLGGNDHLVPGPGADVVNGGNGHDIVDYGSSGEGVTIDFIAGKIAHGDAEGDTLLNIEEYRGSAFADRLVLEGHIPATLRGNAGDDELAGSGFDDVLDGGPDNDEIQGRDGADFIDGSGGFDIASFRYAVTLDFLNGIFTGEAVGDVYESIEGFKGSDYDDVFVTAPDRLGWYIGGDGEDLMVGNWGNDYFRGGRGIDTFIGGDGNDTISYIDVPFGVAVYLNDIGPLSEGGVIADIWGGDVLFGIESVEGSNWDDLLGGDDDANRLLGRDGNDSIEARNGNDEMYGGAGHDSLIDGLGDDLLDGGEGNDVLWLGDGADTLDGGEGLDTLMVGQPTVMNWATGTFTGYAAGDTWVNWETLFGSSGADTFNTSPLTQDVRLVGKGGPDVLVAGIGRDTILPGTFNDFADGGPGIDTVSYEDQLNGVTVNLGLTVGQATGAAGFDTLLNFEDLVGGAGNDSLKGTNGQNFIDGRGGNDLIEGLLGDDILLGGEGNDNLRPWLGNDVIDGGDGTDNLGFVGLGVNVVVDLTLADPQNTGAGLQTIVRVENAAGGFGNDTLRGTADANVLIGNQGNDLLEGRAGNDQLFGGTGNDTLRPGIGGDIVDGGEGVDLLSFADITVPVSFDLAVTTPQFFGAGAGTKTVTNVENLSGGSANDTLRGTVGDNVFFGNDGNDFVEARDGHDTLNGQNGNDNLRPGLGNDVVDGGNDIDTVGYVDVTADVRVDLAVTVAQDTFGAGVDRIVNVENLSGGSGNDNLFGTAGANVFFGNHGDDRIEGRGGVDLITGGAGGDTFAYTSLNDGTASGPLETITDFVSGQDRFELKAFDGDTAAPGLQALSFVSGAFTAAGQVRFAAGQLQFNTNADLSTAEMLIALPGVVSLTAGDFVFPFVPSPAAPPSGAAIAPLDTSVYDDASFVALTVQGGFLL